VNNDAIIFDRVRKYVTNFTTAIDIGAHEGEWSERMAGCFNSVHCFEPNSFLYDRLCSRFSGAPKLTIYNVAILDFIGRGNLLYPGKNIDKLRSHYVMKDDHGLIDIKTLDSFQIPDCGLLKIDVEGGELPVIQGARKLIRHHKPVIVVEYKDVASARFDWTRVDLFHYMRSLNYILAFKHDPNYVFVRSHIE
jgi:FkbM family methyltransferase